MSVFLRKLGEKKLFVCLLQKQRILSFTMTVANKYLDKYSMIGESYS